MKLVVVSAGLGCHSGGVCAAGEETQNRWTGSKRTRHHHRHQPEGEERKRMTNTSHTRSEGSHSIWSSASQNTDDAKHSSERSLDTKSIVMADFILYLPRKNKNKLLNKQFRFHLIF